MTSDIHSFKLPLEFQMDSDWDCPIRFLHLDGGPIGTTEYSQVLVLQTLVRQLEIATTSKGKILISHCFDFVGGSGVGGLVAILVALGNMHISGVVDLYLKIHRRVFSQPSWKGPSIDPDVNATNLEQVLRESLPKDLLEKQIIQGTSPTEIKGFFAATSISNRTHPRLFTTYRPKLYPLKCTVLQGLKLSLSDSIHLHPVPLGDPPECFIAATDVAILSSLEELRYLYGTSQPVACIVSIGTGREISPTIEQDLHRWGHFGLFCRLDVSPQIEDGLTDLEKIRTATQVYCEQHTDIPRITKLLGDLQVWTREREDFIPLNDMLLYGEVKASIPATQDLPIVNRKDNEVQNWLSPSLYMSKFLQAMHTPGTGGWLLKSKMFSAWLGGSTPLFVLEGPLGVGKTFCVQLVYDTLMREKASPRCLILVHFLECETSWSVDTILGSLLTQTLHWLQEEHIAGIPDDTNPPSTSDVLEALQENFLKCDEVFIVLDGLDMLQDDSDRGALLSALANLSSNLRIFVSSAALFTEAYGGGVYKVHINHSNRRDIETHLAQCFTRSTPLRLFPQLHNEITHGIVEKCSDMFLLAVLHENIISHCQTPAEIRITLNILPSTLEDAYSHIVHSFGPVSDEDGVRAAHALMWIFYGKEQFHIDCLSTAVGASISNTSDMVAEGMDGDALITLCRGLLVVYNGNVSFIHRSLRDFFQEEQSSVFGDDPHCSLAIGCIRYLHNVHISKTIAHPSDRFLEYCQRNWLTHAREAQGSSFSSILLDLSLSLDILTLGHEDKFPLNTTSNLLHQVSYFGIPKAILPLSKSIPIDSVDTEHRWSALHFAAYAGIAETVNVLLRIPGINPDLGDAQRRSPLSIAAEKGNFTVVKQLLRGNVNADSTDFHGRTPLSFAAALEQLSVVNILLRQKEVNVQSCDNEGRTPLFYAAEAGAVKCVKILLSNSNVDPASCDKIRRTPLSYAAEAGAVESVKILLSNSNVDPDSCDKTWRTPLSYAAEAGAVKCVKILLSNSNVNPDSMDEGQRTPLSYAAEAGAVESVKILLSNSNVDPDSMDEGQRTPLSYAAEAGAVESVKILLSNSNVNPDSMDEGQRTPLSYAAKAGAVESVELLLSISNVDPDSCDKTWRTPLSYAAEAGAVESVKILLFNSNVDPDSMDKTGRTPLSYANAAGTHDIAQMFLSNPRLRDKYPYRKSKIQK